MFRKPIGRLASNAGAGEDGRTARSIAVLALMASPLLRAGDT